MINLYYKFNKKSLITAFAFLLAILLLVGCSGGGGSDKATSNDNTNGNGDSNGNTNDGGDTDTGTLIQTLTGTVYTPDGKTPISEASVYIENRSSSAAAVNRAVVTDCTPPENASAYDCTGTDGKFSLDISSINNSTTSFDIKVIKGSFVKSKIFDADTVTDKNITTYDLGALALPADVASGAPKIAVVSGSYDYLEDILAKSGMGSLNSDHHLLLESEMFDLYNGHDDVIIQSFQYPYFLDLFESDITTGKAKIYNYDMVLINAGNAYEDDFFNDQTKSDIIRAYVNSGGKLLATDWSYNFVEQAFPEFVDFFGSDEISEADPEYLYDALVGVSDITSMATINDSKLKAWLQNIACEAGNCINEDGTVTIKDFLSTWTLINSAHSSQTNNVKIWVNGPVTWEDPEQQGKQDGVKPLAISFNYGQGKVLISSFHTDTVNTSSGFWPQERILQYLIFGM